MNMLDKNMNNSEVRCLTVTFSWLLVVYKVVLPWNMSIITVKQHLRHPICTCRIPSGAVGRGGVLQFRSQVLTPDGAKGIFH
jgi:hypothetical protein